MTDLFQEAVIVSILAATVRIATPILLAAMGELIVERGGIWNMGVEGTMLFSAFFSYFFAVETGSLAVGVAAGVITGSLSGMFISVMTSTLKVDHFVSGLGYNLLAGGVTLFCFRIYTEGQSTPIFESFPEVAIPVLSNIPYLGEILFTQRIITYFALLLVPAVWYFLYKTQTGLEIRSMGENPKALDMRGLSVIKRQYLVLIGGSALIGLGGAFLVLGYSDRFVPYMTGGRGWLAIVAIVAGNWLPYRTFAAVLVFAFLDAIATHAQALGVSVPHQFFLALPYVASIVLIMVLRSKSRQPVALGIPYRRE